MPASRERPTHLGGIRGRRFRRRAAVVVRRGAAAGFALALLVGGLGAVALGAPRVGREVTHVVAQAVRGVVQGAVAVTPAAAGTAPGSSDAGPGGDPAVGPSPVSAPAPGPGPGPGLSGPGLSGAGPASPGVPLPGPADWPGYGGGTLGNTFAASQSPLTPATVGALRLAWQAPAGSEVSGEPIAVGNRVFFTTHSGSVHAVALDTGRMLWEAQPTSAPLDGGALYDAGRLFVPTSDGTVVALDASDGHVVWTSPPLLGGLKDALRATPQAYGGVIYESLGGSGDDLNEQGGVVALDERTGQVIWRTLLVKYNGGGAAVFSPPAIVPQLGELVVGTGNPTPYPGNAAAPGAVPAGPDPDSDSLVALSLSDGHELWAAQTHPHDASDADFIAAPNVVRLAGGRLAVGDGEKDGAYHMFDAATGQPLWNTALTETGDDTLIVATSAVADGRVFVGTMDVPDAAAAANWPANYQSPGTGRLVALDAQTGAVLWSDALPATVAAAPVAGQGVVVAVEADGSLAAVDPATGVILWRSRAPGQIWNAEAALSLAGPTLLVPLAPSGGVAAYSLAPAALPPT